MIGTEGHGLALAAFPLAAGLIALAFALLLGRRLLEKWRLHEAAWAVALLMYAAASLAMFLGVARGWTPAGFRVYWAFGAVLNVPYLALGEVYLLVRERRAGHVVLAFILALTAYALWAVWAASLATASLRESLPLGKEVFGDGSLPYRLSQLYAFPAYFFLLGGSVWSAYRMRGRPELRDRTAGTVGIAIGATIVAVGSGIGAGFNIVPLFSVGLAVGIAVMFWGFLRASGRARRAPAVPA